MSKTLMENEKFYVVVSTEKKTGSTQKIHVISSDADLKEYAKHENISINKVFELKYENEKITAFSMTLEEYLRIIKE